MQCQLCLHCSLFSFLWIFTIAKKVWEPKSHEVATSLISQQHRVRFSDTVEEGSIIFSLSGVAFIIVDVQKLFGNVEEAVLLAKLEKFMCIHRNSFLLLLAALHETREWETMIRIQQRFLGSNLRIIPVHNTNDIVKSILTIAKATCKPAVDNIWCRMVMATAQITDRSLVWEMLHKLQLGEE
ncbi:protein SPO16 homolog isoform X2 [Latimeria chalumnae]|uniref:protein SPO16 homolog isoform X2 n=1 Tax=Latimeria chalumnae TaxID=7897 RepID=UPI0003C18746|nr:PREDICTED: uncharacterized protein C1orf146 homolog isoform X2 [Latimeria chalumnae]|eukprot:XP_006001668.1 PREDICTED: uncharacterized protein C1orf146 homolog isoform X2 [Latimeria chalumnae]